MAPSLFEPLNSSVSFVLCMQIILKQKQAELIFIEFYCKVMRNLCLRVYIGAINWDQCCLTVHTDSSVPFILSSRYSVGSTLVYLSSDPRFELHLRRRSFPSRTGSYCT